MAFHEVPSIIRSLPGRQPGCSATACLSALGRIARRTQAVGCCRTDGVKRLELLHFGIVLDHLMFEIIFKIVCLLLYTFLSLCLLLAISPRTQSYRRTRLSSGGHLRKRAPFAPYLALLINSNVCMTLPQCKFVFARKSSCFLFPTKAIFNETVQIPFSCSNLESFRSESQ